MPMEIITYAADGLTMKSEVYTGRGEGRRPGVLVFPEAFGPSENARDRARKLADLGYVALASDLHGEGQLLTDLDTALGLLKPMRENPLKARARAQGGLDALLARPDVDPSRIMAIGYCFGGTMALELSRGGAPITAAVGFHSGLGTARPHDAANIKAKVLVCIGGDDPSITGEQRLAFEQEMKAGHVDYQVHVYGGVVHSFTNPEADSRGNPAFFRYDPAADARSWAAMLELFGEVGAPAAT